MLYRYFTVLICRLKSLSKWLEMPPKNINEKNNNNLELHVPRREKIIMIICTEAVERSWRACSPDPILAPATPRRWAASGRRSSGWGWCNGRFFQSNQSWPFGKREPTGMTTPYRPGSSPLVDQATSLRRPLLEGTGSFRSVVGRTKVVEHRRRRNRVSG